MKDRPGVMLYFNPNADLVERLDDAKLAALMRAVFRYANPARREEPNFEDETLVTAWLFLKSLIDRDEERYKSKGRHNAYSVFCRWYKHYTGREGKEDYPPDIWADMGCPSFKQLEQALKEKEARENTNVSNKPDTFVLHSYSPANSSSSSMSVSDSNSILVSGPAAPAGHPVPPVHTPALEEVKDFVREEALTIDAEKFFHYYAGTGWKGVADWREKARYWDTQDREKQERRQDRGPQTVSEAEIRRYVQEQNP